jgi:hypothetical protein
MWKRIGICWWMRVCVMWKWAFSLFELEILFLDDNDKCVVECYIIFWKNSYMLQRPGSLAFVGHNLNFSDGMSARNCYLTYHIYWNICSYVFKHNVMFMSYPQLYWSLNCAELSCLFFTLWCTPHPRKCFTDESIFFEDILHPLFSGRVISVAVALSIHAAVTL